MQASQVLVLFNSADPAGCLAFYKWFYNCRADKTNHIAHGREVLLLFLIFNKKKKKEMMLIKQFFERF